MGRVVELPWAVCGGRSGRVVRWGRHDEQGMRGEAAVFCLAGVGLQRRLEEDGARQAGRAVDRRMSKEQAAGVV